MSRYNITTFGQGTLVGMPQQLPRNGPPSPVPWLRKILPGHQSPLSEKTSYKLVSINWRDTFGKTQALPCALSSSKKCNWPSSSFHNKFWNSGFESLLTAFLKTNLSLQNKSQFPASPVSKDQQLLWLPAKPESQEWLNNSPKSLLRLRTRQAWNLRITRQRIALRFAMLNATWHSFFIFPTNLAIVYSIGNDIYCLGGGISLPPSHSHLPTIECHSSFWCHQWLASPWESAISAEKHLAMLTSYTRFQAKELL